MSAGNDVLITAKPTNTLATGVATSLSLSITSTERVRLQFLHWPLEALQTTLTPIDPHVKMAKQK